MADSGSLLLGALGKAFGNVLKKEIKKETQEADKKKQKDVKQKKTKKNSKKKAEEKSKKETEEKHVVREGHNSLITYPNASTYSIFAHVRHLVLQTKLCETYNSRLTCDSSGETDAEDEEEAVKKEEGKKMPVVVGLGVKGVFTIVRDIWHTHPELCLRALKEFLNILQGQSPSGLKDEPLESTDALFELLMQMVAETGRPDNQLVTELSSVASACLLSLVVALGDTSKMLAALTAMLTAPGDLTVLIPEIFYELQTSVQAVLLGAVMETDWSTQGVPAKSLVEQWSISLPEGAPLPPSQASEAAIACDGQYLYVHGPFGLLKVGSGYGNTKKGFVYESAPEFFAGEKGWLGHSGGKLYFFPLSQGSDTITVLDPKTLSVETSYELEVECQGPQCLFCDSEGLGQIMAKKEGGYVLRKFTTLCSPLPCVEEKSIQLSQMSVMGVGKAKYVTQESLHSIYNESSEHATCVIASRSFAAVQTESGKLMYTGSGVVFGLTGKETSKGEWKMVEFPDKNVKVEHCSCDNAGTFSLVVTDKGVVYFGGLNKKGEAAEPAGARAQPKPLKLKRIAKLKDQHIVKTACGTHTSAMISKDGKLFMFGNLDADLTEKSSGVVTGLLGVPASQVAIGRSHTCVLTQHGTVFTFGNNMYGQCGRNFVPSPNAEVAEVEGAEEEEEESSSDEDLPAMCEEGSHVWSHDVCMVCMFCGYCTGYGPGCCNEGSPDREPGNRCGCGSGDSGCKECGCCRVCAGDKDKWGGALNLMDVPEDMDRIRAIRGKLKGKKKEKKDKEKEKAKKEDKSAFGLQLLFGGQASVDESQDQQSAEDGKVPEAPPLPPPPSKKPEVVPFPDDQTAMQVDCGTFHTAVLLHSGEVYTFGNGNHGQLGQGNNKVSGHAVKVPLPEPATQVACGDNHTVVLLQSGQIFTFGKHQEGQLGRQKQEEDDESWHMVPRPVSGFGDHRKAMWIGARGNQTFIAVDESLVSENSIGNCKVFGNSQMIGLVPPAKEGDPLSSGLIMIDRKNLKATRLEKEGQQNLKNCAVTIDPEYNILWSYSSDSNKVSCFNPIAANIEDSAGTILSSSICLPRSKEAQSTRSHLAVNLLSCLSTLSTHPPLTIEALAGQGKGKYDKNDFSAVVRFNAHGGGWGYSASSVEAVRFSPDTEVLLGGFGLYGGRGTYNAEIKVFDIGENGGTSETEGTLLASHTETGYTCERMQTCRVLFDKPVVLNADHWYIAFAAVSSPAGASSDAGSSGQQEIQGTDKVTFRFKSSKRSNNGTDVGSGQIPEILYRIPEIEKETGFPIQLLDKGFSSTVSPAGLKALLSLLEWSWTQLSQLPSSAPAHDIQHHAFIAKSAIEIVKTYIQQTYPKKGKMSKPALDCPELAESVYEARTMLINILSTRRHPFVAKSERDEKQSLMAMVTEACCSAFQDCFHAFYPTSPLKWFALCQQLQHFDPRDIVEGVPMEHLLSALLDALADPTVSYIGLGYDTTVGISTAIYNSEPNFTFPILSEYMQMKTLEENEGGELLGFNAVATKLLGVVTAPIQNALNSTTPQLHVFPVVSKAGNLLQSRINELALCIAYPESAQKSGLSLSKSERREQKVVDSSLRFSTKERGYPSLEVTDVSFSVNTPILLHGVTLYGGTDASHKYKVVLYQQADPPKALAEVEGSYSQSDYYGDGFVNIKFKQPSKLEAEAVYTAHVELIGEVYDIGVDGKTSLTGPGGVTFTLHHTGLSESNPESGPLVKFLYSQTGVSSGPQNVVQMSVHLASILLHVMVGFLERAMREGLRPEILELLGSSFLYSTLLPTTLAQLGPVACRQPKHSVEVVDLVKHVLPVVSAAVQSVSESSDDSPAYIYSDTKLLHYATVETDHPYKPASVSHYKVKFSSKVQWMSLEFDPRCGFSQSEDKIGELLIPRCNRVTPAASPKQTNTQQAVVSSPYTDVSFDELYADWDRYALSAPPGVVVLPGNEVHIVVNTDTEYDKKDNGNHFGLKCQVVGYEWTNNPADCLLLLEKELVSLGAMCAASMLKENTVLPFAEELSVSGNPEDPDKADMRIVQASAQEVLGQHSQVLNRGLMVEIQTINNILNGDIPVVTSSNEQLFLTNFMESKGDTPGGRLARWLQPDRAVDLEASELSLPTEPVKVGNSSDFTLCTKDQDGKPVFVDGMKVEVKALWLGHKEGEEGVSVRKGKIDRVTGVRKPLFKKQYHSTRLNSNYLYHSISMMMHYQDYSFEELRLFAPKVERSSENMPLKSNEDGSYVASWVPSTSGKYLVQVFIDGKSAGQEKAVEVVEPESPEGEDEESEAEEEREGEADQAAGAEEEQPQAAEETQDLPDSCKPKMKLFSGKLAAGLRIRAEPSFLASSVGVIKPGESFTYTDEVENASGKWVLLTKEAMQQFGCPSGTQSAYALAYSAEKDQEFLEDKEPPPELIEKMKKELTVSVSTKKPTSKKRQGGLGSYEVVQCGSAGHNVRSNPGLKGTPIGRLTKGSKIEAVEEVENDDGIWLKLSKESTKKYCESESGAWTLAVGPSGRIFLALEGDDSYLSQIVDSTSKAQKPTLFPTAASVFGTANQSVFGTPISEITSGFQFGSGKPVKLQFGGVKPEKFEFKAAGSPLFKVKEVKKSIEESEKGEKGKESASKKPLFQIGVVGVSSRGPPIPKRTRRRSKNSPPAEDSKKEDKEDKDEEEEKEEKVDGEEGEKKKKEEKSPDVAQPPKIMSVITPVKQALSPAMAECQRAVFAAFLWQEGLVHDAIVSASYLKFHPELSKEHSHDPTEKKKEKEAESAKEEKKEGEESDQSKQEDEESKKEDEESKKDGEENKKECEKEAEVKQKAPSAATPTEPKAPTESGPVLPPTLNHLVTFWDEISTKVVEYSSLPFPSPKVPVIAQELQKRYEEERKEIEKRRKEKDKKAPALAGGGGGGSTVCELCDGSFPDPVTYHMKDVHPGCGKHASGWGYNSRGTFCSGWAGNCGDGGRGGSTWYLMCKDCHAKYLAMKDEMKKKSVKTTPLPKMKTRKPGKPRSLPVISAVQGMIQNAKFLLEISRSCDSTPTTPAGKPPALSELLTGSTEFTRQVSSPMDEMSSNLFNLQPPSLQKVQSELASSTQQRPSYLRSYSIATGTASKEIAKRPQSESDETPSPVIRQSTVDDVIASSADSQDSSLMMKPSRNLRQLMYNRSRQGPNSKESGYKRVMAFVLRYHDLDGLRASMKQAMRVAGIRTFALDFLEWLLMKVDEPSIIHDVLWLFNCSLSEHPVQQMAAKIKAEGKGQKNSKNGESEEMLGKHPLSGLDGAGTMLSLLRKQFHSLLQTTADIMPKLPMGSAAQQAALQCYCLQFKPQDHSFLLQSNVFTNISKALSLTEESQDSTPQEKKMRDRDVDVVLMEDIPIKGKVTPSSNAAMGNSLTDGSTETFWESRDEPRGRPRHLTITFDKEKKVFGVSVHIDNQKDGGQRVESISLLVGRDGDSLKEVDQATLLMLHTGWKTLLAPEGTVCSVVRVEVKGLQNNVRVRQIQVLGVPVRTLDSTLPAVIAQQKSCEGEALRVFRLLTSQVFGGLLTAKPAEGGEDETDSPAPPEGEKESAKPEDEVREHVVDFLSCQGKLSGLQKQVCNHIVQSVHTEMLRMKEEWEANSSKPPPPKPSRQTSSEPSPSEGGVADTYCYELLSMLIGLSQSEVGCAFLSEQDKLIKDLFTLLHVATVKIQMQVCTLLRKILPDIGPKSLATMLGVKVLPPLGYSAIAEAVNSAATINQLGILDCLLAVIAKALSVQVKAKGRSTNILQLLTGESSITALSLACLVNPKPVPGETTAKAQRWYLKGVVSQEVASEVVKLLKDMITGALGNAWEGYSKSAVGQAVLHLTKVNEEARVPVPGMYSQTLWLCLAALCVIDKEHAEALSSGQWLGQDGKPKTKPLCDNHDDGETQALILCEKCGNLCGECDRVLHYRRATKAHQRQVFKEEEEAVKVELHEGCGRIKLYWTMALADFRTLKGMVEFREAGSGGGKGSCRFCGTTANTSLLAIGSVCTDPECLERSDVVCDKILPCGHACCGVKGEEKCLPCLHGCAGDDSKLKQDAEDMCMMCYTEGLSYAACIQLECGHLFHYHCCRNALTTRWSGPRILFRFMFCPLCTNTVIGHAKLADVLDPVMDLYEDVKRKCLMRLEYENLMKSEAITSPTSKFYQKPLDYAMWKYAYYVCHKCKKAYYGGEANCAEQLAASDDYDPTELVCPACANVGGGALQVCPKHGTDFLEYKCRYCCSVAVYFCFGTTHFCNPCHDDFQRLTGMAKAELPQCPVGPCAKPLEGAECPLHVKHPPTGEEFALGCGVCRNAQTF